ncbi:MAG: DUF5103 domain-containing protein [Bacteroidota bacterium]|nr:DUF5103 domain-containing protein [Bacteroidota bacterium]
MKQLLSCVIFLLYSFPSISAARVNILGLRIYANGDEYQAPIITQGGHITIEFDVDTPVPPNLQILFMHASKDWVVDNNIFLNDLYHNRSQSLLYITAPNGVRRYTFHYLNSFPDSMNIVRFLYSGNYIFSVFEREHENTILAEGRFIVVENLVPTTMTVANRFYPETASPFNQMHYITVHVNVPPGGNQPEESRLFYPNVKTVDIFQNWKLYNPSRIDVDNRTPDTFVDNITMPEKTFTIRNVSPGNEYRRLDLSSTKFYPNYYPVQLVSGADLSRFQWQGSLDANGAAKLRPFIGGNSEYLDVTMRLKLPVPAEKRIFLAGAFNAWQPSREYEMVYDTSSGEYRCRFWLRRGVYDYQYVLGDVDRSGKIVNQDWLALEGNDWRTTEHYTAVVYYHDNRYGGFDRAVGMAAAKSPGGTEETPLYDRLSSPQEVN